MIQQLIAENVEVVEIPQLPANHTEADARRQVEELAAELRGNNDDTAVASEYSCQVCWENYNGAERRVLALNCGHAICLECAVKLGRFECPKCRAAIRRVVRLFL